MSIKILDSNLNIEMFSAFRHLSRFLYKDNVSNSLKASLGTVFKCERLISPRRN